MNSLVRYNITVVIPVTRIAKFNKAKEGKILSYGTLGIPYLL